MRFFLFAVVFALLRSSSAPDVQSRAQALLQHARELSDIRATGAPAFHLTATFSFVGDDLETTQGTYTETWVSDSQWRREIVVGDAHRTEVGGPSRTWRLDGQNDFPEIAERAPYLMSVMLASDLDLRFGTIAEHPDTKPPSECAVTKPDAQHLKSALCFDTGGGVLLERVSPETHMRQARLRGISDYSCDFGNYRKFGERLFPWQIVCFIDQRKRIAAMVTELSFSQSSDSAAFAPPPGAIEIGRCSETPVLPRWISAGLGTASHDDPDHKSWVTLWLVVDVKGRAQSGRVVHSPDRTRDDKVLKRTRDWFFEPGTCHGVPMPFPLTIEIPFQP
jgi:hypothetical protein